MSPSGISGRVKLGTRVFAACGRQSMKLYDQGTTVLGCLNRFEGKSSPPQHTCALLERHMILADLGPPVSRQFTLPVIGLRLVPKHSETFPHDALELVAGPLVQAEGEDVGHLHKIPLPCDDTFHGLRLTHNLEQAVAGI